jgi:hypothetical protein
MGQVFFIGCLLFFGVLWGLVVEEVLGDLFLEFLGRGGILAVGLFLLVEER